MEAATTTSGPLTKPDLILAALAQAPVGDVFTASDVVVMVWQSSPQEFGLEGFTADYPDSNKALTYLMGKTGLCSRGYVEKVAAKRYRLTQQGMDRVRALQQGHKVPSARQGGSGKPRQRPTKPITLSMGHQATLCRCLDAAEGIPTIGEATFAQAVGFWCGNPNPMPTVLLSGCDVTAKLLAECCHLLKGSHSMLGQRQVVYKDARRMLDLHTELAKKFGHHLNIIRYQPKEPSNG